MGHTIDPRYRAGQTPPDQVEGEIPLALRRDASGALVADGEYTSLLVDSDGRLKVADVSGGGTEYTVGDSTTGSEVGPFILVQGSDGTYQTLKVDASTGALYVDVNNDVTIVDGGGSITVDGTVTANAGTGPWPVTDNGGSLTIDDGGGSITVDGTVSVTGGGTVYAEDSPSSGGEEGPLSITIRQDTPSTTTSADGDFQNLKTDSTGHLYVKHTDAIEVTDGGGALTVDGTVTANAGTGPWPVTDNGGSLTVDGTVTANAGTGPWPVTDNGGSLTVDGTVTANAGTGPWPVTDNGGSLTVDGTVTANGGSGTFHVVTSGNSLNVDDGGGSLTIDDGGGSITVDGTVSVVGGGTVYTEDDASTGGEAGPLTMTVRSDTPSSTTSADGDFQNLKSDSTGHLYVKHTDAVDTVNLGATIDSGSVSVTTSAAIVKAADSTRRSLVLTNLGSDYVFIGDSAVAVNTGIRLAPSQALTLDKSPTAAVYAIATSGTQTVAWFTEEN